MSRGRKFFVFTVGIFLVAAGGLWSVWRAAPESVVRGRGGAKPLHEADAIQADPAQAERLVREIARCRAMNQLDRADQEAKQLNGQNARRLAMLAEEGHLRQLGRAEEILEVLGKYGDSGMDFVWRNKGALTVSAALAAFLADPEPFIDGSRDLATIVGQAVVQPLAEASGAAAKEAARNVDWTAVTLAGLAATAVLILLRLSWRGLRQTTVV